jgi:hypothetical protein
LAGKEPHIKLSRREARRFLLAHQGLLPPRALRGEAGVLAYLRRVRSIQFDPLDVAGRNPELVLQARVADYRPQMLERLLYRERALVEGWDKQASIWPVEDWPGFRRQREQYGRWYRERSEAAAAMAGTVLERVLSDGPLSSHDMEHRDKVDWPWGPARIGRAALEALSFSGELVIHHRERALKVYDVASRRIPRRHLEAPDPHPDEREYLAWRVLRRLRGVGMLWSVSGAAWLGIPGVKSRERAELLELLCRRRNVLALEVEGIDRPFYVARADAALLDPICDGTTPGRAEAACLAPLDNLLWDRALVRALFDFDYVWEVYKPAAERRWGYYVLPVLYGDRFVARFEPARDPRSGEVVVKRWWWESGVRVTGAMRVALRRCLGAFAAYLGQDPERFRGRVVERALARPPSAPSM